MCLCAFKAVRAGKLLKLHGLEFDEAHASVLKRAVRTLWTALHSSNQHWIPVEHSWRLNGNTEEFVVVGVPINSPTTPPRSIEGGLRTMHQT